MGNPNPAEVKRLLEEAVRQRAKNSDKARKKLEEANAAGALQTEYADQYRKMTRELR